MTAAAPVVLIPTPGQLAAGTRTVEAEPGQVPASAGTLLRLCESLGLTARPTYALALVDKRAGWQKLETVAVRIVGRGWAIWENGRFASAQYGGAVCGLREFIQRIKESDVTA
jgi:hypothetical protein